VRLVLEALRFAKTSLRPLKLALAGEMDDISPPLVGTRRKDGETRREWNEFVSDLSPEDRRRIQHLGNLKSSADLRGLYNAADLFCSLSLYHDEDFGMSPAEALCSGTACVLTAWGGFSGFKKLGSQLVPVKFKNAAPHIESKDVQQAIHSALKVADDKYSRSKNSQKTLSVDAIARLLQKSFAAPEAKFNGFNALLSRHAEEPPAANSSFYRSVYQAYLE